MRILKFFNNASFKLAAAVTEDPSPTGLLPDRPASAANVDFQYGDGEYTVATITDPAQPGVFEIVHILGVVNDEDQEIFLVERGREQTQPMPWAAGALVECRVTQGMLSRLHENALFSATDKTLSLNWGDVDVVSDAAYNTAVIEGAWAIGGAPVGPARGYSESSAMASSVEGVGYSNVVELGVAPNFDPDKRYYPGEYARDTASPFKTYAMTRWGALTDTPPPLGVSPWALYAPETDSNIVSFQRLNGDKWFYPTEIGFICEEYTATAVPTITVKEVDFHGSEVGDLVAAKPLTGAGTRQRIVLSNNITKGIRGLNFVLPNKATGGSCRGRFYWKGFFICTNSALGFPAEPSSADGS